MACMRSCELVRWWNGMLAIVILWGVVLPRLERSSEVQARIKHLDKHGIDPAAMFNTDHEGMTRWEANIHEAQRRDPAAFW